MVIIVFKLIILTSLLILILYPFFSKSAQLQLVEGSEDSYHRLLQQKEVIYTAIKELDFDYHMGKLSQEDYQNLRANYQQQAVDLLKHLEESSSSQTKKKI